MSFITVIGSWIKGWRLDKFIKGLVNGDPEAAEDLQAAGTKMVQIVDRAKAWIKSPQGEFLTYVIPGDEDDKFREKAIDFLEKEAEFQAIITGATGLQTAGEKLTYAYGKVLETGSKTKEDGFWHDLASSGMKVLTSTFADGKITFGDGAVLAEMLYRLIVKKKPI